MQRLKSKSSHVKDKDKHSVAKKIIICGEKLRAKSLTSTTYVIKTTDYSCNCIITKIF